MQNKNWQTLHGLTLVWGKKIVYLIFLYSSRFAASFLGDAL